VILLDVNVLVYSFREDIPEHEDYRIWLEQTVTLHQPFGLAELVLSGFLRVVTHPRVFTTPSPLENALAAVNALRSLPNCVMVTPGARHWPIFVSLLTAARATGRLVPDAYLAALAIESGSEWITTDRDFARFPGLRWRHPLAG
jgi:uncharacterized protein